MSRIPFRERLAQFMAERRGFDELCKFLSVIYFVIVLINIFVNHIALYIIALVLFGYTVFRAMSRNIEKREAENKFYLGVIRGIKNFFVLGWAKFRDRKTHVYRRCPKCKNALRLPKKSGEHAVKCPVCENRFEVTIK